MSTRRSRTSVVTRSITCTSQRPCCQSGDHRRRLCGRLGSSRRGVGLWSSGSPALCRIARIRLKLDGAADTDGAFLASLLCSFLLSPAPSFIRVSFVTENDRPPPNCAQERVSLFTVEAARSARARSVRPGRAFSAA